MNKTVVLFSESVPNDCLTNRCEKDRCKIRLDGIPTDSVILDMDCTKLPIPDTRQRCDYLFVGEIGSTIWVAPIEMKSGGLSANEVLKQLEEGVRIADNWLPPGARFQ